MAEYEVTFNGKKYRVEVEEDGVDTYIVRIEGKEARLKVTEIQKFEPLAETDVVEVRETEGAEETMKAEVEGEGTPVKSAMAGVIVKILVKEGDEVKAGDEIMVIEAMKMENAVNSPVSGKVSKIIVNQGDRVSAGDILAFVV